MKKTVIGILCALVLLLILYGCCLKQYLTLENVQHHGTMLQQFVGHHYIPSVFAYVLMYIFAAMLALPMAALLTVTGGYLFGVFYTVIFATIGATIGAIGAFLLTRYLL